jgi:hypothetical protein
MLTSRRCPRGIEPAASASCQNQVHSRNLKVGLELEREMQEFQGGCHCGNVVYTLRWPLDYSLVLARCSCTFCTKHGAIYTAHRNAILSVTVKDAGALARYKFETETAYCHFCARCHVYLFATSKIDGQEYAVINANSLKDFVAPANIKVMNFEGETIASRLARRSRTWIGDVTIVEAKHR